MGSDAVVLDSVPEFHISAAARVRRIESDQALVI
jgi:hypothetical protein